MKGKDKMPTRNNKQKLACHIHGGNSNGFRYFTPSKKKKNPTQKRTEPTNKYCLSARARNILFLCAMELHCWPQQFVLTSHMIHPVPKVYSSLMKVETHANIQSCWSNFSSKKKIVSSCLRKLLNPYFFSFFIVLSRKEEAWSRLS